MSPSVAKDQPHAQNQDGDAETHTPQLKYQQNQSISASLIEQCYTTQTEQQSQQCQLYCNDVKSRETGKVRGSLDVSFQH